MRSKVWLVGIPLLGGWANVAAAQQNQDLTPFVDARLGGAALTGGRGSQDNDADLLFVRERFDPNFGVQSLYFRVFDNTNDVERFLVQGGLQGAHIQNTFSDFFSLSSGDALVGVGNIGADYGGFNNSRGLEGQDLLTRAANDLGFVSSFTTGGGIDDFRVVVDFPDLDPGGLVNRGSASITLQLFAGGATAPLGVNLPSGTDVGVHVGDDLANSALDDGDYTVNGAEPEGNGGFNNPSRTQSITIRLLFEDLDIAEDELDFTAVTPGVSTVSLPFSVDNFAQGFDLDNDNGVDGNGGLPVVPNLSLERIKVLKSDLTTPSGAQILAAAIQVSTDLGRLDVGEFTAVQVRVNVPANAAAGNYSGPLTVWEDNNNNGAVDAGETSDIVTLVVPVQQAGGQDLDNDGLTNAEEDVNGNDIVDAGETDPNNADTDNDGLEDGIEVNGQNPTNPLKNDTDNDGLLDGQEDANHNGIINGQETDPNDADTDNGGEPDGSEVNGNRDPLNPNDDLAFNPNGDDDNDGLRNGLEDVNGNGVVDPGETDAQNPDSDQDGLDDGTEDADHDGVKDADETDPRVQDTDADGLLDGTEVLGTNPTDPLNEDSDNDGQLDGCEDGNHNGALNTGETNPNLFDTDSDGIPDGNEDTNGNCRFDSNIATETDGTDPDTDDGGELDGSEVDGGRDPRDPSDDLSGSQSFFVIGGGSCAVTPGGDAALSWLLLGLAGLVMTRRRKR